MRRRFEEEEFSSGARIQKGQQLGSMQTYSIPDHTFRPIQTMPQLAESLIQMQRPRSVTGYESLATGSGFNANNVVMHLGSEVDMDIAPPANKVFGNFSMLACAALSKEWSSWDTGATSNVPHQNELPEPRSDKCRSFMADQSSANEHNALVERRCTGESGLSVVNQADMERVQHSGMVGQNQNQHHVDTVSLTY